VKSGPAKADIRVYSVTEDGSDVKLTL
jgi:hypothetical protein